MRTLTSCEPAFFRKILCWLDSTRDWSVKAEHQLSSFLIGWGRDNNRGGHGCSWKELIKKNKNMEELLSEEGSTKEVTEDVTAASCCRCSVLNYNGSAFRLFWSQCSTWAPAWQDKRRSTDFVTELPLKEAATTLEEQEEGCCLQVRSEECIFNPCVNCQPFWFCLLCNWITAALIWSRDIWVDLWAFGRPQYTVGI